LTATANYPLTASDVTKVPAADDPEVKGVSPTSGGETTETPESKDQNKPETYEGLGKKAAPQYPVEPGKNEEGLSVEPAPANEGFDANAIADQKPGPYQKEPDEPYMDGEFTNERYHVLGERVKADSIPRFNVVDAKLASLQDGDVKGLRDLVASITRISVDLDMPGMSKMQLRALIDHIVEVRQEAQKIAAQYEAVLKQMKGLEEEEATGLKTLKEAAGQIREKGKYLVETENALLEFTAYLTDKVPGIEQMIAKGEEFKGQKAGDFFGRIAKELGDEIGTAVAKIYEATKEDLTHSTMAIRGLKVVQKSASFDAETQKTAGIADIVVSIKEWLAGKADAVAQRILGFSGDISKWIRGFTERTKMVKGSAAAIQKALDNATKSIDAALAPAKTASDETVPDKTASDKNDWGFNLTE
jgi:hypothetical protein